MRREIRITGFGGQGVILAGYILGKAACVFDTKAATLVQSYGPEARGSACAAQVVIADETIHYPYVKHQDILVAMSQEGYDSFAGTLVEGGVLLYDEDLVDISTSPHAAGFVAHVPALRGCWSQGDTRDEALRNVREAVQAWLEAEQDKVDRAAPQAEVELITV